MVAAAIEVAVVEGFAEKARGALELRACFILWTGSRQQEIPWFAISTYFIYAAATWSVTGAV